jgi:ACT domain
MFGALAEGNINIEMISQGASEINISCVIDGRDSIKALNLIHETCLHIRPEGVPTKSMSTNISHLAFGAPICHFLLDFTLVDGVSNGHVSGFLKGKISLAHGPLVGGGLTSGHVDCDVN